MPATVASLQAFRSRRTGAAAADGPPAPARRDTAGEYAALATAANDGGTVDPERARRFRDLALPQLDAAYNLARHLARDADAAEDIVQDAYLRALRGFDGYRGGDPRAWILQIVRNRFYDWARERRLDRSVPLPGETEGDEAAELPDPDAGTPEEALAGAEAAEAVQAVVAALPAPFREALVLREMEDLSYREIAAVTGTPIGTVMSRLARARQMFGEAWRRVAAAEGGKA
ncbi:sigma-70 family RNA polymerase sigma factor [Paracraurococcus lichenis]|uniref:RNA polymerase sigma factor n=1 Tax=Paracraurococcus lichenis TaxID=3064888 RepID=A0ABT9ED62_9PROT|nr:sigma-70 family RNA polymerase sigma factor [Paracraurococcus sp. LOR1-02]MDO9713918.1 sigma-70 family RNA polymerase sigma factor [Paracraurococcus sp. LOR1-02]